MARLAYLELHYKRFNPRGGSYMPYYMTRQDYDLCNGLGVYSLSAAMVIATAATPVKRAMDFPVDLMVLDGAATLRGARVAERTAYSAETSDRERTLQQYYDFDGDEVADTVVAGKRVKKTLDGVEKEVFVSTSLEEAELQGIYLSSRHDGVPADTEADGPDFTRLIDTRADFQNSGLLEHISREDLQDTDIYVFRESNGQLLAERRGLHEDELYKTYSGVDDGAGAFRSTIQLRGSVENYYDPWRRKETADWQRRGGAGQRHQHRDLSTHDEYGSNSLCLLAARGRLELTLICGRDASVPLPERVAQALVRIPRLCRVIVSLSAVPTSHGVMSDLRGVADVVKRRDGGRWSMPAMRSGKRRSMSRRWAAMCWCSRHESGRAVPKARRYCRCRIGRWSIWGHRPASISPAHTPGIDIAGAQWTGHDTLQRCCCGAPLRGAQRRIRRRRPRL